MRHAIGMNSLILGVSSITEIRTDRLYRVDSGEKPPIRLASGFERKAVIGLNAICNCMFGQMSTNTTEVTAPSGLLVTLA